MSNQLWDRQRDEQGELEPMLWFGRFSAFYLPLGTERTIEEAYRQWLYAEYKKRQPDEVQHSLSFEQAYQEWKAKEGKGKRPTKHWYYAASKWSWKKRAEAKDAAEMARIKARFQQECDAWRANRFSGAQQLWDIGKKMLDTFPVARQTVKKDGETTIIEPITGVLTEIARVWKLADELARTTTRETLPVKKIAPTDPSGKKEYQPLNLENLNDAELERLGRIFAKITPGIQTGDG